MNNLQKNILKTLAYFDLFHYPVTRYELQSFLRAEAGLPLIDKELRSLLDDKILFQLDEFYSLQNKPELAERRHRGNLRAVDQLIIARSASKILNWFPFVQSIAVSGSLSKHFSEEKSDIDFFIITSTNRLWIARTLMHLLKKLSFIVNKQHWFCMNYYVDESALKIPEENIFTAMEIVTLIPMQGMDCFQKFREANAWASEYFPLQTNYRKDARKNKKIVFRTFLEKIFSSRLGDKTDQWLKHLTDKRWRKKMLSGKVNGHGDKMEMMVGRHFSKPNPKNFQAKIIQQYEWKVNQLLQSNQQANNIIKYYH